MNYIFDIGNVLVTFKPLSLMEKLFPQNPNAIKIAKTIFLTPEWLELDKGTLTFPEACEIFCGREPDIADEIRQVFKHINDLYTPLTDSVAMLSLIKEKGHNLYFLSNISFDARDYMLEKFTFLQQFDGGIYSCDVGILKPDKEIYQALLNKYNLAPSECIFFDDVAENAQAAEAVGIKGVQFINAKSIADELYR